MAAATASRGLDLIKLFGLREEYGVSAKKGELLFAPGQPADSFWVVLRGRVQVERAGFDTEVVPPGEVFGEVDVFTEQARHGAATALDDCSLLAFTRDTALKLAEATPSFALVVIRHSCERVARAEAMLAAGDGALTGGLLAAAAAAPSLAAALPAAAAGSIAASRTATLPTAPPEPSADGGKVGPVLSVDYASSMWKKDVTCPNCHTTFHAWNVRSQAINLTDRESDFKSHYEGVDPNWYAVWVCPSCNLAAYADDFAAMQSVQVARVKPALEEAKKADPRAFDFTCYRDEELALRSFQLAIAFYDGQRGGAEKCAGLYHRMAWIERGRGNAEAEKPWLEKAREYYEKAFTSSDAGKAGVLWAYLIAELGMRLGRYQDAIKWFGTAAAQPDFKAQPLLEKMVRDRWSEAGDMAKSAKAAG